jgi:uncharacterized membrane protein
MPVQFQISVDIVAPPETVWAVMLDAERWHEWTASVRSIRLLDARPLRIGSRALIRQPRFPPAMWKVTALDPGRSFTWKSGMPGMWVHAQHSVTPSGNGTRAVLSLRYEGVVGRLLGRLTRGITDRYLGLEAAGLKQRSEEHARPADLAERRLGVR